MFGTTTTFTYQELQNFLVFCTVSPSLVVEHIIVMSYFTFPCIASDYERTVMIGRGSFSQVWKARVPSRDAIVAIKVMDLENISSSFEDILQEVQTMKLAEDPNILRCLCSFVHLDQLWLITELMDKGSCVRLMKVANSLGLGEGMNEECLTYILHEAVKGLSYLHKQGQIHRDIKAGNILLNSAGEVKLADFGVSSWTVTRGQRINAVKTFVGTPCYMAPEVMEQVVSGYDSKADVWSIGITALELAKGYAPYAHLPPMQVLIKTIEEEPPSLLSYTHDRQLRPDGAPFSEQFTDFCNKCLQKLPKNRPKAEDLLKHKIFKQSNKSALISQLLCYVEPVGADSDQRSGGSSSSSSNNKGENPPSAAAFPVHGTTECDTVNYGNINRQDSDKSFERATISASKDPDTSWVFEEEDEGVASEHSVEAPKHELVIEREDLDEGINRQV